jgi:hypothetical protein
MDEIISYKMCAVKVRNAKLRNYLNRNPSGDPFMSRILQGYPDMVGVLRLLNGIAH